MRVDLEPKPKEPIYQPAKRVEDYWPNQTPPNQPAVSGDPHITFQENSEKPKKKRRTGRRLAAFAILLAVFASVLYGTSVYLRGIGVLPSISNPFTAQTGTANTDINLRPSPNVDNDPIGLVTKNSRVRIVKRQNNWYQVDVIEQGRDRDPPLETTRGWLNGRYIDLD